MDKEFMEFAYHINRQLTNLSSDMKASKASLSDQAAKPAKSSIPYICQVWTGENFKEIEDIFGKTQLFQIKYPIALQQTLCVHYPVCSPEDVAEPGDWIVSHLNGEGLHVVKSFPHVYWSPGSYKHVLSVFPDTSCATMLLPGGNVQVKPIKVLVIFKTKFSRSRLFEFCESASVTEFTDQILDIVHPGQYIVPASLSDLTHGRKQPNYRLYKEADYNG